MASSVFLVMYSESSRGHMNTTHTRVCNIFDNMDAAKECLLHEVYRYNDERSEELCSERSESRNERSEYDESIKQHSSRDCKKCNEEYNPLFMNTIDDTLTTFKTLSGNKLYIDTSFNLLSSFQEI